MPTPRPNGITGSRRNGRRAARKAAPSSTRSRNAPCAGGAEEKMPNKDRESFLMLLERLGSADDAEVVKAARETAQRLAASGLTWEDLLRPPTSPTIELTGDDAAL